jgi:hypothetical protein
MKKRTWNANPHRKPRAFVVEVDKKNIKELIALAVAMKCEIGQAVSICIHVVAVKYLSKEDTVPAIAENKDITDSKVKFIDYVKKVENKRKRRFGHDVS